MIHVLPVLFIFLDACVEPLEVDFPNIPPTLVVDGLITDQPGPYEVRLFYTTRLDSTLKRPKYETGATVFIDVSDGNTVQLFESEPGIYQTNPNSTFKGEIGKSYSLRFVSKGRTYRSEPQKMLSAGTIDDLSLEFINDAVPTGEPNGPATFDGFKLLIDSHGEPAESNLFRWRWTGVYKLKTFPELRTEGGVDGPIPDPEPCSGYIKVGNHIEQVAPCTCCICWSTEYSQTAVVSDNEVADENTFNKVQIGLLPITSLNFYEKYHIEVEQLSLSEDVYEFWRLVEMQQTSGGNIFQPNAIKIRGNIKCENDPDREVLGAFSVSAVVKTSMFVYPEQIPVAIPTLKVLPSDCRNFENATTTEPDFW